LNWVRSLEVSDILYANLQRRKREEETKNEAEYYYDRHAFIR